MSTTSSTSQADTTVDPADPDKTTLAVYKSPRHAMMYLYLSVVESAESDSQESKKADLDVLPEELLKRFGPPVFTLNLELWPGRKLAQADASAVLHAVATQGFYLQMPPNLTLPPTPDAINVHS